MLLILTHYLNAQVGYTFNDWHFNLFGTNFTNEKYYTSLVSNLKSPIITHAPGVAGSLESLA